MNWAVILAAALALWGWAFPPPIVILEESERAYETSLADTTHDEHACYIHVYPSTWAPEYDPFKIVAHEVGHCLSLGHHDQEGIMNGVYEGYEFSGYDRALFWWTYPAPYRVTIGMVSK